MADKAVSEEASMDGQAPKPTSIPVTDNTVWADASPLLDAACIGLRYGELIHGDNFNLFAAMSALEIMDPKMDSGIVCRYYSIDEAIENGAAPVPISLDSTIDVQCTIDIMDHLLACEAAWHKGHSLAQTVFSCIYLLRLDRTASHALLHSYGRVIRATCKAVLSVVSDARTHEEEDLFTMTYGLPLNGDGDEKCLSMLNAVEETISRQLRACKATSSKRRVSEDLEPLQYNPNLEEGFCKALLCRLRFRKHFFHVLTCMKRPQGRGLELARKHIASCISELEFILKSAEFLQSCSGESCEDDIDDKTTASGREPIGFDASLNSRLSAPTPPRAIKILSWKKLVMNLLKILCTNAAWQRRKLGKILQDWRVIYLQLELALRNEFGEVSSSSNDENICMKIFQHILIWVEEQTYWIACRFLMLGFELELYSASEYCMVYWYSYAVLIKLAEKTHLKMAVSYDTAKRKGKKKRDSPKDLVRESRIPPAVLFLQCYICLAEGLTMMLAALRNEFMILQSPSPFNTEQEKFVQHFELLQRACIPDHASYLSFKESTTHARFSTLVMYNYFKDAQRIAKEVKSSFSNDPDRLAELRKLEQVAEHNSVALNLICRLGALDPSLKVSFEFSHHPFFATAVVRRS
ncbi:uncharacterized protein LOC111303293 isoform X6 [Durio zibethinus]|uniref:Uncharacterized protein LOC111303293 isoform X6 n=1 Tax=Durio zibethinus TaxID=66656 RepID=A0A6P5ZQY7_DURZI|nr:uncharacterized protein LOC111303293 isoform X6 [Durio zibethinus]